VDHNTPKAISCRIAALLDLPADDRVVGEISDDRSDWVDAWCDVTGRPAAVYVEYSIFDPAEKSFTRTEVSFAGDVAGDQIRALLNNDSIDPYGDVRVTVCRWWLRFAREDYAA
jgi:hypothetical protein